MADKAHDLTDKKLVKMERHVSAVYSRANKELTAKAQKYFAQFAKLDEQKKKLLGEGKITEAEYNSWKQGKIMMGKHWQTLVKDTNAIIHDANAVATSYINSELPNVYALNYNAVASGINSAAKGVSFELVDPATVRNLTVNKTQTLLPYKVIDEKKEERWNSRKISAEVLQGILQGESMPQIAKRFSAVMEMSKDSAIRNARTTVTSAENKGRMDMLHDAADKGVITHKVWMAAIDARTRDWHADLNGVEKEIDEPFENVIKSGKKSASDKIMYPGDPHADPANVYNCRCTLVYKVVAIKRKDGSVVDVKYGNQEQLEKAVVVSPYKDMSMTGMYYSIKDENKALGKEFWETLENEGKPSEVWKAYLNNTLSSDTASKLDSILSEYKGTGSPKKPVSEKKKAEKEAEKQLEIAKDAEFTAHTALTDFGNPVYSGIWKEDTYVSDYPNKVDSIPKKKDYFEEQKLSDPDNPKWDDYLAKLEQYEKEGKEYQILKADYDNARRKVQELSPHDSVDSDKFSQERKDAALWAKNPKEADDVLREHTGEIWRNASQTEREAIYNYTNSYSKFNEPLRGIEYGTERYLGVGNTDLDAGYQHNGKKLDAMTDLIDKSSYDTDVWLQRGVGFKNMDRFFELSENELRYDSESVLKSKLLDTVKTEYGFCSCADAKGKGFDHQPIILNIYAPAGTKMIYAEPFSAFGNGSGLSWDGVSGQRVFGSESEVILQQNTSFRITKIERSDKLYIDMEIIDQGEPQRWRKK